MKQAWDNFNKKKKQLTGNMHNLASRQYLAHMHTVQVILFAVMRILNILAVAIPGRIAHVQGRSVLTLNIRLMMY